MTMVRSQWIRWVGAGCSLAAGTLFGAMLVLLFRLDEIVQPPGGSQPTSRVEGEVARLASSPAADQAEDFYQTLAAIEAEPRQEERKERLTALADRWLAKAPAEAFSAFLAMAESDEQLSLLHHLVSEWVKIDERAVFARLRSIDGWYREVLQGAAVLSLKESDVSSAVRWLESLSGPSRPNLYRELFLDWTEKDMEAAKRKVVQLRNPEGQERAARAVARAMALRDSEEALDWAESLQEPVRTKAIKSALAVLAFNNPRAAWESLQRIPDGADRNETAQLILERWGRRDPAAALNWADENAGDEMLRNMAGSLILNLAERDPQAAVAYLDNLPLGDARDHILRNVIGKAAYADPDATAHWVEQLSGADRSTAIPALLRAWASFEPREAAEYAEQLGEDEQFWPGIDGIAGNWSRMDPAAAVEWAESLPDGERLQALVSAAGGWAQSDPVSAAGYVGALDDATFQQAAAERVVTEWGQWQPAEAAAWVQSTFDDPAIRGPSYRALASLWLDAYPRDASAWIATLPEGVDRDAAVTVLLEDLASADPQTAAAWAGTLFDPALRESWQTRLEGGK